MQGLTNITGLVIIVLFIISYLLYPYFHYYFQISLFYMLSLFDFFGLKLSTADNHCTVKGRIPCSTMTD